MLHLQSKMLAGDNSAVLTLPLVVSETLTPVSTRTVSETWKVACSPRHLYQVTYVCEVTTPTYSGSWTDCFRKKIM